jgi:hypothetical protein
MRYLLYLVMEDDGMSLVLVAEGQPRPAGESRLIRGFPDRRQAMAAMDSLQEEFVVPVHRCLARA